MTEQKSALDNPDTYGLGLLFGQEANFLTEEDVYMAINGDSFDPAEMIIPASPITHGWRKTVKVITPEGKTMSFTVGEGPMFNENSSDSETESSTLSPNVLSPKGVTPFPIPESTLESVKEPNPPLSVVPASSMVAFDVFIFEFNKMNSHYYILKQRQHPKATVQDKATVDGNVYNFSNVGFS